MARQKIADKFNGMIVVSVVVSSLVISTFISLFLIDRFTRDLIEKDQLHLHGLAGNVKGFAEKAYTLNHQLSVNPIVVDLLKEADPDWQTRLTTYLRTYDTTVPNSVGSGPDFLMQMQEDYPYVELFFLQDVHGDQVARSYGPVGHRGQRWWFQKLMSQPEPSPFFSKSYYSMTGDKPVSSVFHPVGDGNEFLGILGTDINFEKLQELIINYMDTPDLYAVVLDREGVIIAHPDKQKMQEIYNLVELSRNVLVTDARGNTLQDSSGHHKTTIEALDWDASISEITKNVLAGKRGYLKHVAIEETENTVYFEPVPLPGGDNANYAVLLIRNTASIARTKMAIAGFVAIFTLFTIVVLIFAFHNRFNKIVISPLHALTASMKKTATGDAARFVELNTNDEFQDIAQAYNAMHEDMKQANRRLAAAGKMEALGLVAGGIAHDLNNILTGMLGYPDLILSRKDLDSTVARHVRGMQKSALRASAFVADLLTISRGVAVQKSVLQLNDVVDDYFKSLDYKEQSGQHPGVCVNRDQERTIPCVEGSAVHIEKCVMNLIVNAMEAVSEGGHVTIGTSYRELTELLEGYQVVAPGSYVVLTVKDDGPGIPAENLSRIFEPFFTRKEMGFSGTGFGLTIVWNTMKDHDGFIDLTSDSKGTTFALYFPATDKDVLRARAPQSVDECVGTGTILVVDDEEEVRDVCKDMLEVLGYSVSTVSSGEEAIAYLGINDIDLVVLDMIMGKGLNGRQTFEAIHDRNPAQRVILASGYAKNVDAHAAINAGALGFIHKPYTLEALGHQVRKAFEAECG